ncbi:MAG TPA: nucleotide sugar dehydrogenase [Ktedonobacteraceae bacterium]
MATICVIGTGYVGLVTGTCFADMGNRVTCVDIIPEKVERLRQGLLPIYEPGLKEMVERNVRAGRLHFTTSYAQGLSETEFIFIAVNTPTSSNQGGADMSYVERAARSIAQDLDHYAIIINKSTVPVGSGDVVTRIVHKHLARPEVRFSVVSNPEFLAEGSAVSDFQNPDRVVLGSSDPEAANKVATLYLPLRAPIVITDLYTAEMIKYASNAFLATRISFINEIAQICERLGADVKEVAAGMGHDRRIGKHFLNAGLGYGGSCFEANETVFTLNSPNIAAERFDTLFVKHGTPVQGDVLELVQPRHQQVLAFDLATGQPVLAIVKAVTRRPYTGTMVRITTSMGRTLRITADHPVVVYLDGQFALRPADAIVPGNQLMTLCALPAVEQATHLNVVEQLANSALAADVYVRPADALASTNCEHLADHLPAAVHTEFQQHSRLPLQLFCDLSRRGLLDISADRLLLESAQDKAATMRAMLPVDADLLRLCGYYLTHGETFAGQRANAEHRCVGFCFHADESEALADLQCIVQRLQLRCTTSNSGHGQTLLISSPLFAWLLHEILGCGRDPQTRALPRLALNVAPHLRLELLRGVFSSEQALTLVQHEHDVTLAYTTTSKALADGLTLLLQTLGLLPSLAEQSTHTHTSYELQVNGPAQVALLKDTLGAQLRARLEAILACQMEQRPAPDYQRHGAFATLTVREVECRCEETTVYSMETSSGTLIASSGLISHNCFPKDVRALAYMADEAGLHPQLLHAVMDINHDQRRVVMNKLTSILGSLRGCTIGILGLAFKPNTDDMREAPSVDIIRWVINQGARVQVYDPVASETGRGELERAGVHMELVQFCEDAYAVARGADALVVATEWNEFKSLNMAEIRDSMRRPIVIDGRNVYEPAMMHSLGFTYRGMGRGTGPAPSVLPSDSISTQPLTAEIESD